MCQMKFEDLPNEILLECFQYLNIIDIFHSFDQLNYRFNSFIRNIPFSLNFENIENKFQCEEFCMKLSTDQTIQNQLYSLCLSNQDTCYPVHLFISKFSLLEFTSLRSLTLHRVTKNNWNLIQSNVLSISKLSYFRMIDCSRLFDDKFSELLMLKLQTLIIPYTTFPELILNIEFALLIHLSIYECEFDELLLLLTNAPKLNYLKVELIDDRLRFINNDVELNNSSANNLKTLHIKNFHYDMNRLSLLLKRTPNLENLTLFHGESGLSYNWQNLITNSLSYLKNFKFIFLVERSPYSEIDEQRFKEFQNDCWFNKHHWHMEYSISEIYTLPYPREKFKLLLNSHRYYNESFNYLNTFKNVKYLTLDPQVLTENNQNFFPNIESLSLGNPHYSASHWTMVKSSHLKYLQIMVHLSNIKHLILLNNFYFETADIFKKTLKSATQLSSLTINLSYLLIWFNSNELSKYFNKTIRKLQIFSEPNYSLHDFYVEQFCKIFSNLEQLECSLNDSHIIYLIKYLPKLKYIGNYIDF
ncbi:hypothetical protein I4U23_016722 [Adineta vaga]|nr:hypothetical protein I4U23_016722 [Adineta vaga]